MTQLFSQTAPIGGVQMSKTKEREPCVSSAKFLTVQILLQHLLAYFLAMDLLSCWRLELIMGRAGP